MKTTSFAIQNLCVPCSCHCKYCLLSYDGKLKGIDYEKSKEFVKRFYAWIKKTHPDWSFMFYFGYSMEHPNLFEAIDFLKEIDSPITNFLQLNGLKMRKNSEIESYLSKLKERGIKLVDVTLYGNKEYHDKFAGRKGDYDYMWNIIRTAIQVGIDLEVSLPIHQENKEMLEKIVVDLENLNIKNIFNFIPHQEGRGECLNPIRLTLEDYLTLNQRVQKYINLSKYKTESEWLKNKAPIWKHRNLTLSLTKENIESLEKMKFEDIVASIEAIDEAYYSRIPDFSTLAKLYGDQNGTKFYSFRDLYYTYKRKYIDDNHIDIYDIYDERQSFSRRF